MLKVVGFGPGSVAAKMVGRASAAATMASIEAFTPAMVAEKVWMPFFRPPRRRLAPRTSRTLPMIEPMIERSEEHTSELQSRQYLVCRLLLEKKKKITKQNHKS